MTSFKGAYSPKDSILQAVFSRSGIPFYRDLKESQEERGVKVNHATLNRRVIRQLSSWAMTAENHQHTVATSWRPVLSRRFVGDTLDFHVLRTP